MTSDRLRIRLATSVLVEFCYEIKEVDSKRKWLEIINLLLKYCFICIDVFYQTRWQFVKYLLFSGGWSHDMSYHVTKEIVT